jgi:hypothetical protein
MKDACTSDGPQSERASSGMTRHKRTFVRFLYRTADAKISPQSIDRTARKVDICRTFVWMIAVIVPPADERLPTAVLCTDRVPVLQ